jgi:hypothetical protein
MKNLGLSNTEIKRLGLYLVLLLVLLRFLILPLYGSVKEKKVLWGEVVERYQLKAQLAERRQETGAEKRVVDKGALLPYVYDKAMKASLIQSEVLEELIKLAEKKGLTVLNFEMMEPPAGKGLTELSVLIRLKGQPKLFFEMLKDMEKQEKILNIKSLEINRFGQEMAYAVTLSIFKVEK